MIKIQRNIIYDERLKHQTSTAWLSKKLMGKVAIYKQAKDINNQRKDIV